MRTRTPRFAAGPPPLTARQEEVLHLLARGRTNYEIATALGISLEGAKYHVREIMTRLGADSREEAVVAWRRSRQDVRTEQGLRRWISGFAPASWMLGGAIATIATVAAIAIVLAQRSGNDIDAPLPRADSVATPGAAIDPSGPATSNILPILPADPQPYDPGTRSGVAVIDSVLSALERRDASALATLLSPFEMACSTTPAIGGAACPAGVADGTTISVLGVGGGEGSFTLDTSARRSEIASAIVANLESADENFRWDSRLIAIADAPPFGDNSVPGDYLLVFASGHWLSVDSAGITFANLLPRDPVSALPGGAAFLLPPLGAGGASLGAGSPGTISHGGRTYTLASDLRLTGTFEFMAARYSSAQSNGIEELVTYLVKPGGQSEVIVLLDGLAEANAGRTLTSAVANADGSITWASWCDGEGCRTVGEGRTDMTTELVRSVDGGRTWESSGQREGDWRVLSLSESGEPVTHRVDVPSDAERPVGNAIPFGSGLLLASPEHAFPVGCTASACTGTVSTPAILDPSTGFAYLVNVAAEEPGLRIEPIAIVSK